MNGKEVGSKVFTGAGAVLMAAGLIWVFSHASAAKPHPILSSEMESNYEKIQIQLKSIDDKLDLALADG